MERLKQETIREDVSVTAALPANGVRPAVAEALRFRVEISCGRPADDLSVTSKER